MNLYHLKIFHEVARSGGVTRAAERLMVSQPAVSKQLKDFERSLKTPLLERDGRGVRLTAEGELLAGYARRVFALVGEAEAALEDASSLRRGVLAVGASPTLGAYLLPAVLVRFRRRFPGIVLRFEVENAAVLHRRVAEGGIEAGITEVKPSGDGLVAEVFGHDVLVPVVPAGHALAKRRRVTAGQFLAQPLIVRDAGAAGKSLVEKTLESRGLSMTPALSLGSTEAVKQAVAAGLGVAIVPRMAAQSEVLAGRVVELPVKRLTIRRPLYVVRRAEARSGKALTAFLCLLRHGMVRKLL